jgi:phage-related protein
MHKIFFYQDGNGREPVAEYIEKLSRQRDKNGRIKINKIYTYIDYLRKNTKNSAKGNRSS